ncbi:hypothetical protein [Kordiimonas lacus]|uniref:Transmembrane protein n=1 Tax=Kordiimonas lacus TaxID=637679 RepID=A0A1G7DGJ0_9PROT|nr:hypothetical protein [Kordiimonas lacus]SDE50150.1 hypothetical protein SAMN04488071_3085 [Kordiimonas lacus]
MMPQDEKVTPQNEGAAVSGGDDEAVPSHTGMKVLVIGLGIAILAMVGLMVYKISERAAQSLMGEGDTEAVATAPVMAPAQSYGDFQIERPAGATLMSVTGQGAELVFHFRSNAGDTIITLNRVTGEQAKVDVPLVWQDK